METECASAVPNPYLLSLAIWCRQRSVPVVLLSDTYLTAAQLRKLLSQAGVAPSAYERLYASSEAGANKSGGSLFKRLLQDHPDVDPAEILHIGDDPSGDDVMARAAGLQTLPYRPSAELFEVFRCERLAGTRAGSFWQRSLSAIPNPHDGGDAFWWAWGATVLGPAMSAYCHWVLETCLGEAVDLIAPVLREGDLFAALLSRAAEGRDAVPPICPLHISRQATLCVELDPADPGWLERLAGESVFRHLQDLPGLVGLEGGLPAALASHGATRLVEVQADAATWSEVEAWIAAERGAIEAWIAAQRALLAAYVGNEWEDATRVATVDFGARGTVQARLQRSRGIAERYDMSHYLFYAVPLAGSNLLDIPSAKVFCGGGEVALNKATTIYRSVAILERLLNGELPATVGYGDGPGGPVPVVADDFGALAELDRRALTLVRDGIDAYQPVEKGVIDRGFTPRRKHIAAKAVSPSSETMRTI